MGFRSQDIGDNDDDNDDNDEDDDDDDNDDNNDKDSVTVEGFRPVTWMSPSDLSAGVK